jgi:hypothetical protein
MTKRTFVPSKQSNPNIVLSEKFMDYLARVARIEKSKIGFRRFSKYRGEDKNHTVEPVRVQPEGNLPYMVLRLYNNHSFMDFRVEASADRFADILEVADNFYRQR